MNTDKHTPAHVFSSLCPSAFLAALGLIIILAVIVPQAAFGVVYVNKNATGANDGSSWADAYTTIQVGIDYADVSDDEVWVAQGTYYEAIVMKSGVAVYGGFNGTETDRSQRNWTTNVTTIDGSTARGGSAAYHVVTMDSITNSSIDGFTITGGNGDGASPDDQGGGIYCSSLDTTNTIANNEIVGNWATSKGGGIYCHYSSPSITNNTISGNRAYGGFSDGGGIYCYYSSPTIADNTISENKTYGGIYNSGGGLHCDHSSAGIMNNTISLNYANYDGGGIYSYLCSPTIANNTISENSVYDGSGGGINCSGDYYSEELVPIITNNTISGNSARNYGGGIYCTFCSPIITENTISENTANWYGSGGGICCEGNIYCVPTIAHNTIVRNSATYGGGIHSEVCSLTITNNTISGNGAQEGGGIYGHGYLTDISNNTIVRNRTSGIHCYYAAPTINNNILAGNSGLVGGGILCDNSYPLIVNNTISGNSASYKGGGILCRDNSSPEIKNTIFSDNSNYDIYEFDTSSDPLVSYNDFYNNADGVYYDEGTTPCASVSTMDATIPECNNNIGLDALFIGDTLSTGTWTAEAVYSSSTFQTMLTDSSASWTADEHSDRLLNPDTSQNKQFVIASNTATTITVWARVTSIVEVGDQYMIFDYHLQNLHDGYPVASPCIDAGDPADDYSNEPEPNGGRINQGRYGNTPEASRSGTPPPTPTPTPTATPTETPTPSPTATPAPLEGETINNPIIIWGTITDQRSNANYNNDYAQEVAGRVENGPDIAYVIALPMGDEWYTISADIVASDFDPAIYTYGGAGSDNPGIGVPEHLEFLYSPYWSGYVFIIVDSMSFDDDFIGTYTLTVSHALITPTPTPTPTPSPTPWQIGFDFIADRDDWTTGGAPIVFTPPDFVWEADYLKMTSRTNTNTFGFWQSLQDAIPADADYLYRARFTVSSNLTATSLVPQIRLRANSLNLQQYDVLSIESAGDGGASPAVAGTDYDLYFVPPANDTAVMLSFDLLNFNADDAAAAELTLDTVTVDRFALDSLSTPTIVQDYDFELTQDGWTTGGAPIIFSPPQYIHSAGALELRAITNTNTFGFWGSHPADITIEADRLYRGTFEVRTDLTNPALVPEMRLRYNAGNLQASHTFGISSIGDGANSPGTTNTTYDRLYFLPPANCVGEDLIVSFDILNFSPDDATTASLILDRAIIETLSPPALP